MRKAITLLLIFSCLAGIVFAQRGIYNSFNSGEVSPDIYGRVDVRKYYSGCRTLENMFVWAQGPVEKRRGTYYIASALGEITTSIPASGTPAYPILRIADFTFETRYADPELTQTTEIDTLEKLQAMENNLSGNYYLSVNIDASDTSTWNGGDGFDPIGTQADPFTGTFDGCGYTISNLTISRSEERDIGLFGAAYNASIANVTLANVDIHGHYHIGAIVGLLYGNTANALVQNCHSSGIVKIGEIVPTTGNSYAAGGIVGMAHANEGYTCTFKDCTTSCTVDGTNYHEAVYIWKVGGFGGFIQYRCKVYNCRATGDVTAQSYGFDNTEEEFAYETGGFVGVTGSNFEFYDCATTGDVTGGYWVGGFASWADTCIIERCSVRGNVTATNAYVGGFLGQTNTAVSEITDCYTWANVASGHADSPSEGSSGFVTSFDDTTLKNTYCIGTITIEDSSTHSYGYLAYDAGGGTFSTGNYWDVEASGESDDNGEAVPHTTEWMQTKANFVDAGYDLDTIWYMPDVTLPSTSTVEVPTAPVRLIEFISASDQGRVIELGNKYMTFYKDMP